VSQTSPLDGLSLISTTRSVRRRLDLSRPVDLDVLLECLTLALQAPNGADEEAWRWIVVTDPEQRRRLGEIYRRANEGFATATRARAEAGDPGARRKIASAGVFWEHLEAVPALVVACFEPQPWFDPGSVYGLASAYGSVFPAVWNLQLACRLHGLGSCLVTSHLRFAEEVAAVLDLPPTFQQAGMVAIGHLLGESFRPARRRPRDEVVRINAWSPASK
jgi:nitroreductase